jgi:phosphonopyruvate decarboxylase
VSVPCSVTDTWHTLAAERARRGDLRLTMTAHEGNLAGIAAGIWFGTGRPALVHMQNSGLTNAADGFISLASDDVYDIPFAAMVTFRGADDSETSEPHQAIGRRTETLIDAVFGGDAVVAGSRDGRHLLNAAGLAAEAAIAGRRGVVKVAESGLRRTVTPTLPDSQDATAFVPSTSSSMAMSPIRPERRLARDEAILAIAAQHPDAALLFCNGYTARAAQALVDGPRCFHNIGYMGGTLAIGWALARSRPDLQVVVVDGDQNALMSTMKDQFAAERPANLVWYVLDNGIGASVGTSESIPLGTRYDDLATVIRTLPDEPGSFRHPRVGTEDGSPLNTLARRFRGWIADRTEGHDR